VPRPRAAAAVKAFFQVLTPDEARAHLATFAPRGSERIAAADAAGRVLAADVRAPVDLPHFHRANMDGYAVRAPDTFGASASVPAYLRLAGTVEMGKAVRRTLGAGEAMRISTGGMLPAGADAVVMVEYTEEVGDGSVEVHRPVAPWEHVVRIGDDVRAGEPIFAAGRRLRGHDLGALTGVGITRVAVHRRPRVALLATGDEIVPPDATPRPGQVRNVNQYSLRAMIAEAGGVPWDLGLVPDRPERLRTALRRALGRADVVMLSGGSSVGAKDMTLEVIGSLPGAEILFHGISIAPGKPTILARAGGAGRAARAGLPVLGLPGHPVSALVIFHRFGAPLVRIVGGEPPATAFAPARVARAVLGTNVDSQPGREDYVRVVLEGRAEAGGGTPPVARPIAAKSAAIFSLVRADGMIRVPLEAEGLEAGTEVEVMLF
jgi:molybdopterin molybdotransferase